MKIRTTPIEGVCVVETDRRADDRGSFARLFCEHELATVLADRRIVQINQSTTAARGAVRGLHFQRAPEAEMKLVRCLRGEVWDVAVDLRAGSPTFLQWHGQVLSRENGLMMTIPEGCAHGFQTLAPDSELLYLHTAAYASASEGGLDVRDPRLAIAWPLPVHGLSPRDASHPALTQDFKGIAP